MLRYPSTATCHISLNTTAPFKVPESVSPVLNSVAAGAECDVWWCMTFLSHGQLSFYEEKLWKIYDVSCLFPLIPSLLYAPGHGDLVATDVRRCLLACNRSWGNVLCMCFCFCFFGFIKCTSFRPRFFWAVSLPVTLLKCWQHCSFPSSLKARVRRRWSMLLNSFLFSCLFSSRYKMLHTEPFSFLMF